MPRNETGIFSMLHTHWSKLLKWEMNGLQLAMVVMPLRLASELHIYVAGRASLTLPNWNKLKRLPFCHKSNNGFVRDPIEDIITCTMIISTIFKTPKALSSIVTFIYNTHARTSTGLTKPKTETRKRRESENEKRQIALYHKSWVSRFKTWTKNKKRKSRIWI